MPRRGDGLYQRGTSWYLDCRIDGHRHVERLGKGITRTVAQDLARVKRGAILKGEGGIGHLRKDLAFRRPPRNSWRGRRRSAGRGPPGSTRAASSRSWRPSPG